MKKNLLYLGPTYRYHIRYFCVCEVWVRVLSQSRASSWYGKDLAGLIHFWAREMPHSSCFFSGGDFRGQSVVLTVTELMYESLGKVFFRYVLPSLWIRPWSGETAIFITPGYTFKVVDGVMTNFHLPRSTLFMLVSALVGTDTMQAAYAHAIETDYRFYSYGDSSLIWRR